MVLCCPPTQVVVRAGAVIGVFPSGAKGADYDAFLAAAESLRSDYDFGHVTDAALLPEAKGRLPMHECLDPWLYVHCHSARVHIFGSCFSSLC